MLDKEIEKAILTAQENEITEHVIYEKLSNAVKDPHNKSVLRQFSEDELRHYDFWKKYSHQDVRPNRPKIWKYILISKILGLTFGIKLMEKGEEKAQVTYDKISQSVPDAIEVAKDEYDHEKKLLGLIDEERLRYISSMVLGLNDALVELTGVLAGLTLALQNTRLVALGGFITGTASSLSMAASEYLSTKSEEGSRDPLKASLYTGSVYVLTVLFLIFPYFILTGLYLCLSFTVLNAIVSIFVFTFYISVAKDVPFKKRFFEMAGISLGIAAITFVIGFFIRILLKIEV
jgi:VIT1/CCC1 family predicted Fe2+/Mn2+ transporter